MPNISTNNKLNEYRERELYHFCMQYNEWKHDIKYKYNGLCGYGMPVSTSSSSVSDQTAKIGLARANLESKCELVEKAARMTDEVLYKWIIVAVTNEDITFNYLYTVMGIPCSQSTWYRIRKKFYTILDQLKN